MGGEIPFSAPEALESRTEIPDESAIILGEPVSGTDPVPAASGFAVFRMVLVLALVAAAVYGVVFFIRRASRPRERLDPRLKILTQAHLGANRFVCVVNVGNQAWLVGAGEGGVSLISEITDKEALDAMILEYSQNSSNPHGGKFPDFRAFLSRFGGGAGLPPEKPGFSTDNVRKNRERLKGL
ncbi:MAG: flagellar biosynthetic protein FliO [Treponema sp.]|nr:flagellar biosynthetic protein FliO [Treponema sp.]